MSVGLDVVLTRIYRTPGSLVAKDFSSASSNSKSWVWIMQVEDSSTNPIMDDAATRFTGFDFCDARSGST